MANLITFLDIAGRPHITINVEQVLRVYPPTEPTDGVKIALRGDSVTVGNSVDEVKEIVNSGVEPDYDLDENGVVVGYHDPRFKRVVEPKPVVVPSETKEAESLGFGADEPAESTAEKTADAKAEKADKPKVAKLVPRK